jgi:hypothetical protein
MIYMTLKYKGSTLRPARILKFHMVINIPKRNGTSLGANYYQKFVFFELPLQYAWIWNYHATKSGAYLRQVELLQSLACTTNNPSALCWIWSFWIWNL